MGLWQQLGQAIKEFSKSKLRKKDRANLYKLGRGRRRGPAASTDNSSSPLELIRGEIAILKKLNHDNIVKLYEVLDASAEDSMFMGMDKLEWMLETIFFFFACESSC